MLIIFETRHNCVSDVLNVTMDHFNDKIHNTMVNVTIEIYKPIMNILSLVEVALPESVSDENYQRIFFKSDFNLAKLMGGGNLDKFQMAAFFIRAVLASADFELKFPIQPVDMIILIKTLVSIFDHI